MGGRSEAQGAKQRRELVIGGGWVGVDDGEERKGGRKGREGQSLLASKLANDRLSYLVG